MHKQVGRIGSVRRELHGKACPFCGGQKYQLVLRAHSTPGAEGLFARCSQCQRAKEVDEDLGRSSGCSGYEALTGPSAHCLKHEDPWQALTNLHAPELIKNLMPYACS